MAVNANGQSGGKTRHRSRVRAANLSENSEGYLVKEPTLALQNRYSSVRFRSALLSHNDLAE
jgi:hypothetical protein